MPHRLAIRGVRAVVRRLHHWFHAPWADLTDRERLLLHRSVILLSMPLVLAAVIPMLVALVIAVHDSRARSNANRTLIRANAVLLHKLNRDERQLSVIVSQHARLMDEQAKARADNRRRFAVSDRTLCLRIETVRKQIRDSVHFDLKQTQATLRLIGIDPHSKEGFQLINTSRLRAADLEKRFAPKKCVALPSQKANEPQAKITPP